MKKSAIVTALLTIFCGNIAFSQSDEFVMTWGVVENEAKKSDADITNPKKNVKAMTWTERGRKYLQVYTFDAENIYCGMPQDQIMMIMKGAAKSETSKGDTTILSYDRVDFYVVNGKVVKYARTGRAKEFFFPTHLAALDVATEAYIKAKEFDTDGKKAATIGKQLKTLSDFYQKEGYMFYSNKDYAAATPCYTQAAVIAKTGLTGETDSARMAILNNAGLMCRSAKQYDQAISFFQDVIAIAGENQKVSMYDGIYGCQLLEKKDTASAIQTCLTVIEKFPNDEKTSAYLNQLIDLYQKTNQTDKAVNYLQKAIENEPNNVLYYVVLANMYDSQENTEKAIETYKKALEINPKDENANLNLGVLYFQKGKDKLDEADRNYGKKSYASLKNEGQNFLKQAYPYIETYADVTTDEYSKKNAYRDLSNIYMRLGMNDKYKATKAKIDALK